MILEITRQLFASLQTGRAFALRLAPVFCFLIALPVAAALFHNTKIFLLSFEPTQQKLEAVRQLTDSLETELKKASVVVKGKVVDADREEKSMRRGPVSEHDPLLRKAVIETVALLRGNAGRKRWTVYYAASEDVRWYNSPKLKKGQEAIFLLQTNPVLPPGLSGFSVLSAFDVQPLTMLPFIKSWLKRHRCLNKGRLNGK